MKKVWSNGMVMVMAFLLSMVSLNTSNAQGSVSLQVFYDELQPHGTWMQHNTYGYVWIPNVDRSFSPYATNGYWINTEYGNTWVSDYSWGWAPFHYGRWFYDDFYGWMWLPDAEWGPAWVAWRSGGGYYGWAPLMPGFGINASFNYYNRIPHHYWSFVPCRYITYRTVYNHCVPRPQVINIINNTTIITNNYTDTRRHTFFTGPSRNEIEMTNRERINVYAINDRNRPGRSDIDRGQVSFYRPEIDNSLDSRTRSMPSQFSTENHGQRNQADSRHERSFESTTDRRMNSVIPKMSEQTNTQPHERRQYSSEEKQRDFNQTHTQRLPQAKPQNEYRTPRFSEQPDQNYQRDRSNTNQNNQRRTTDQSQSWQKFDRQNATHSNQNAQRVSPPAYSNGSRSSGSQSQSNQQFKRSSSDHRSSQPAPGKQSSPRRGR